MKTIRNYLTEKFFLPTSDVLTGWNISEALRFLNEFQWWSRDKVESYQCERLQRIVKHSYENVSYYRELFDTWGINPNSIQDLQDLKKIPLLTKDLIIENFKNGKLIAKNVDKKKLLMLQSSGSTGKRTQYYITPYAYGFNLACNIRGWQWMGYRLGDSIIKITQNKRSSNTKYIQDYLNNMHLFTARYSYEGFKQFAALLKKVKPKYLRSYPDPLLYFTKKMKHNDEINSKLVAINTTGNILFPEVRTIAEKTFGCKIFDSYNCEGGPNVFECITHDHYHVSEEYGILEIINDNGVEVHNGDTGRVIVTDLSNFSFPFFRYESMDLVVKGGECPLGIKHKTIKSIVGRDNDILITPSGQILIGQTFTTYFKYIREVDNFQVVQPDHYTLIFKLECKQSLDVFIRNNTIKYWREYTNNEMDIIIEIVDDIPLLNSGKRRFLIRDESIKISF